MNVWTKRLIGLLILLVIGLVIFDNWFTPDVPPALQQDISLEVDGESQTIPPAADTADRYAAARNRAAIPASLLPRIPGRR